MHDFKYCIWLCPNKKSPWYSYTKDFEPHITIYKNLNKETALTLFNRINKKVSIKVKLIGSLQFTNITDFYALEKRTECISLQKPVWWPNGAHMSFRYQYTEKFTERVANDLISTLKIDEDYMTHFKLMKCTGHYTKWKQIG